MVEIAVDGERQRHRPAGQQDVELDDARAPVVTRSPAAGIGDGHRRAEHMGDRIVGAEKHHRAPKSECPGVEHRADHVTRFKFGGLLGGKNRGALLVFAHLKRARDTDGDDQKCARPDRGVAGLERRHQSRGGRTDRPKQHRPGILAHRIHERRIDTRRQILVCQIRFTLNQLHFCAHVLWTHSITHRR